MNTSTLDTTNTVSQAATTNTTVEAATEMNLGSFIAYDSQLDIPHVSGTRIVKCLYQKNTKTGTKQGENSYTRIPTAHLSHSAIMENIDTLLPYFVTFLESVEDTSIKALHKNKISRVYTDSLSIDKLVHEMEIKEMGARLNKEMIQTWFTTFIADYLTDLILEKVGDNDSEKLEMIVTAYADKFASLASPKTHLQEADCNQLIKILTACQVAESKFIGDRLVSKLRVMAVKEEDLLLAL